MWGVSVTHSLISDPEVLIKGMTSLAPPVHQVYLHQVLPFKSNDIDICTYTFTLCEDLRADYGVSSFTVLYMCEVVRMWCVKPSDSSE